MSVIDDYDDDDDDEAQKEQLQQKQKRYKILQNRFQNQLSEKFFFCVCLLFPESNQGPP